MNADSLRKILNLEKQRGYKDTAVIWGMEKFLVKWSAEVMQSLKTPVLLARLKKLFKARYSTMAPEKRQAWAGEVLNFLEELENESKKPSELPKTNPKAAKTDPLPKKTNEVKKPAAAENGQELETSVTYVKGVGPVVAKKFEKLGVKTVRDLLYYFPHRHLDYSKLKKIADLTEGEEQTIIANVWQAGEVKPGGRRSSEAIVGDETGNLRVLWFNQPYIAKNLTPNTQIILSGKVNLFNGRLQLTSPEWEIADGHDLLHTGRLVPVYPLTQGLYPRQVRRLMKDFIDKWAGQAPDFLPDEIKARLKLLELPEAIRQAHYPDDEVKKDRARVRLAFDELFLLQLGVMGRKRKWQLSRPGTAFDIKEDILGRFLKSLPYTLTPAQDRVLTEILADLNKKTPMIRLLQGEVGSGKTIVATAALLTAVANGFQTAFMAPTEILAEQHFITLCGLFGKLGHEAGEGAVSKLTGVKSFSGFLEKPLTIALLIGDMKQAGKKKIQQQIRDGEIDIIIGTHALVQKDLGFNKLGLAVVDEQHRFGVEQRGALREKGFNPHMLVMTATPIPRTLALTLYGDLDLSVINELPPGRQTVKTKWLRPEQRESAYNFIRKQISAGRQAFILCPLVEESESIMAQAAVAEYERLSKEVFSDLKMGLLHGRMSSADKDAVMEEFRAGSLNILVSTPVIEVGIDIPNATVMMIESADRFGLSQLHQFRGRVGRGKEQSYCMLMAENASEVGRQRLDIIENTQDGFKLAEEDLKMRGPGEFFGTRQSGLPDLRMARISDVAILELARNEAVKLFQNDPDMKKAEHKKLVQEMKRVWSDSGEWS
jgi:ATP-dependent DNA helicase RecG